MCPVQRTIVGVGPRNLTLKPFLYRPQNRTKVESKSFLMEMMQKTRLEYENGDIAMEEIDAAIRVS